MQELRTVDARRSELVQRLFPDGIPRLWCPPLTHFRAPGVLDQERISQHLHRLRPFVKGILVPGSTGEGWEMNDAQVRELLSVVLDVTRATGIHVLVGVLKTETQAMLDLIQSVCTWLMERSGSTDIDEALAAAGVVGFTVCPPRGADLTQDEIYTALARILGLKLPVALYQLPQITQNEMSPETVARLVCEFPNLFMLKDTSGQDRIALSDAALGNLFLVRGAEGGYSQWVKSGGGPYDGFLLSTANVMAPNLHQVLRLLDAGRGRDAEIESQRISRTIDRSFRAAGSVGAGNVFTNANKAIDHVLVHGAAACGTECPLLVSGVRLPESVIREIAAIVAEERIADSA
jgi:dihydrodipicolinate synthase/N-acetylneuraminate lyase